MDRNRDLSRTLGSISTKTDTTNTKLDTVETTLTNIETDADALIKQAKPTSVHLIADTSNHSGSWYAVTALEDSEVDQAASTIDSGIGANFTIPKGVTIYLAACSVLSLNSGKVIAYKNA